MEPASHPPRSGLVQRRFNLIASATKEWLIGNQKSEFSDDLTLSPCADRTIAAERRQNVLVPKILTPRFELFGCSATYLASLGQPIRILSEYDQQGSKHNLPGRLVIEQSNPRPNLLTGAIAAPIIMS